MRDFRNGIDGLIDCAVSNWVKTRCWEHCSFHQPAPTALKLLIYDGPGFI
jgi:hypothetical protein